jgi:proteasome accessory factor A
LRERICGTECEYAPVYHYDRKSPRPACSTDDLLEYGKQMAERMIAGARACRFPMAGEFLGNGGRLYVDRGGHPEYATPECRSLKDLVAHEKAGDRIIQKLAQATRRPHDVRQLHVYKNNVDAYGNTYGAHENYLVTPHAMDHLSVLIPFLTTRQIYTGAGKLMYGADADHAGSAFQISQRANFFDRAFSDRTSEVRGIITTRKREIPRIGQNQRLHLIVGDSNLCEAAIALKLGVTMLMLRMLEEGALDDSLSLDDPVRALKAVSDVYRTPVAVTHKGRSAHYSALDIQSIYLDRALRFFRNPVADSQESQVLDLWQSVLQGLKVLDISQAGLMFRSDPADLKRKLDWVLKLWLLDRSRKRGADERQLKYLDMAYHDLDPRAGLHERCRSLGLVDRIVAPKAIRAACHSPPANTRARLRGWIIRRTHNTGVTVKVENWDGMRVLAGGRAPHKRHYFNSLKGLVNSMMIRMEDPFCAEDFQIAEKINQFIEMWGSHSI